MRIWLPAILIAVPLLLFAYTSTFSRYTGDDYCWAQDTRSTSFLDRQVDVYEEWSGRWAYTALISLASHLGPESARVLPVVGLSFWLAATAWCAYEVTKSLSLAMILAEVLVLGAIVASPGAARDATIWQSGMLTYLSPVVVATAGLAGTLRWRSACFAAVVAFVAGGFNESLTAAMLAFIGTSALFAQDKRLHLAAFAGAAASGLIMLISPGADERRGDLFSDLLTVPVDTLHWTVRMVLYSLPASVAVLTIGVSLGGIRRLRLGLGWIVAATIALMYAAILPSVYGVDGLAERTAMLPAAIAVLGALAVGLSLGSRTSEAVSRIWLPPAVLLLAALAFTRFLPLHDSFVSYAEAWDARHAALSQSQPGTAVAVAPIEVPFKSWSLERDGGGTIARCMAEYYNLSSLEVVRAAQ